VPGLSSWLYQFWRKCNVKDFDRGYDAMLELSKNTLSLFDDLEAEGLVEFEMHDKGLLFVFTKQKDLDAKFQELSVASKVGIAMPVIKSKKEVQELEPNISDNVVGGLMLPAERHVRPESLSNGLYNWLVANGVEVKINTEVTGFVRKNGRIEAVQCGSERIDADNFLITTGVWSRSVVKQLNYKLPMTAGKGYSITISSPNVKVSQPLYLGDSKVGISPYNDAIRIAGTMELSGLNTKIDQKRVQGLRNSASKFLKQPLTGKSEVVWTGMRPMTPDGMPVLGKVPGKKNVYIATGHAMSGVSMSLSTGKIMADLILTNRTEIDLKPFSPGRF